MQTSNFRKSGKDPRAVAISRGVPSWYRGKRLIELAPSRELMKEKDDIEYSARYQGEVLARLDALQVAQQLDPDAILLCWEPPGEPCHRRLVAAWFKRELDIDVPELGKKPAQGTQPSMGI